MNEKMKMTKIAFLLWCCAASPAFSSACGVEEVLSGELCLPKSLARCQAALMREIDFHQYLKEIDSAIREQKEPMCGDDEIKKFVKSVLELSPSYHDIVFNFLRDAIAASEQNLVALDNNYSNLERMNSFDFIADSAESFLGTYNKLFGSSPRPQFGTMPHVMKQETPFNRIFSKMTIDYHSLYGMLIKESYQKMKEHDVAMAQGYLEKIGTHTTLGRYVQKMIKELPDPDTCLMQDGAMQSVSSCDRVIPSFGPGPLSRADQMRLRLHKKLAQKKASGVSAPRSSRTTPKKQNRSKSCALSATTVAGIKATVERDRQEAAARHEAKRQRVLADQKKAQEVQASLREMRQAQAPVPASERFQDPSPVSSSTVWTAPVMRVRVKTRGVADPACSDGPASSLAAASSSPGASSSSSQEARPLLAARLLNNLETFWETKAGLTYHEVASLFTSLGGRISEKRGGSSHVTLSYFKGDGTKLKHELWRPHGSGNTFGFRTMAGLQAYFERCGLTLKDE